jgi:hypothetical protein
MYFCIIDLMAVNSNYRLSITIITAIGAVSTIVIVTLTVVITILARAKYKVQMELKALQSGTNVLYEEIVIPPKNSIDSKRNVAYDCVTK